MRWGRQRRRAPVPIGPTMLAILKSAWDRYLRSRPYQRRHVSIRHLRTVAIQGYPHHRIRCRPAGHHRTPMEFNS
jgi:hypothetical protein